VVPAPTQGIVTVDEDTDLGRWTHSLWQPPHLARFVERFWYSAGTTAAPRERILPNGLVELALCLGEPHRLIEGVGPSRLIACVTGLQLGAMVIEHPGYHRVLGLRLHPAGAYALLGAPAHALAGLTADLHDVVGRVAHELLERCRDAPSVERCFAIAAAWLADRLARAPGVDPRIAWSVARIERTGGDVPIAELRERTGLSKTRLVGAFREQVGVAPKAYARIVRFRRALALLDAGGTSLADVALDAGYYDQAHMTTEFRTLGGLTPRAFVAARYPGSTTALER